jgi:hypothetical protein
METLRKPVGGFFGLELPQKGSVYHDSALALANGRTCFNVLIERVSPSKVYLPFYCCDTLTITLDRQDVPYEFYAIDTNFDPVSIPELLDTELLVIINYFGLKPQTSTRLSKQFGMKLVIDNTQAFFEKSYGSTWVFNSARKFFGVPDGGFLYSPQFLMDKYSANEPVVTDHLWLSISGRHEEAYEIFRKNEALQSSERYGMSELTRRLLYGVDFPSVARARKRHFRMLDYVLRPYNRISKELLNEVPTVVPFCYPLLLDKTIKKEDLFSNKIYLPTFWTDVLNRNTEGYDFEKSLVNNLLILPVDHRLEEPDLRLMMNLLLKMLV